MTRNRQDIASFIKSLRLVHRYGRLSDVGIYVYPFAFDLDKKGQERRLFFFDYLKRNAPELEEEKRLELWTEEVVYAAKAGWITANSFKEFDALGYLTLLPYLAFAHLVWVTNDPRFVALVEDESLFFNLPEDYRKQAMPSSLPKVLPDLIYRAMKDPSRKGLFGDLARMYENGSDFEKKLAVRLGWIAVLFGPVEDEFNAQTVIVDDYLYALIEKIESSHAPRDYITAENLAHFASTLWDLGLKRESCRILGLMRSNFLPSSFVSKLLTGETKTAVALLKLFDPMHFDESYVSVPHGRFPSHSDAVRFLYKMEFVYDINLYGTSSIEENSRRKIVRSMLLRFLRSDIVRRQSAKANRFIDKLEKTLNIQKSNPDLEEYLSDAVKFFEPRTNAEKRALERRLTAFWMIKYILSDPQEFKRLLLFSVNVRLFETVVLAAHEILDLLPHDKVAILASGMQMLNFFTDMVSGYTKTQYRKLLLKIESMNGPEAAQHIENPNPDTIVRRPSLAALPHNETQDKLDEIIEGYIKNDKKFLKKLLRSSRPSQDGAQGEVLEVFLNLIGFSDNVVFYIPAYYKPDHGVFAVREMRGGKVKSIPLPNPPVGGVLTLGEESEKFLFQQKEPAKEMAERIAKTSEDLMPMVLEVCGLRSAGNISSLAKTKTRYPYPENFDAVFVKGIDVSENEGERRMRAIGFLAL